MFGIPSPSSALMVYVHKHREFNSIHEFYQEFYGLKKEDQVAWQNPATRPALSIKFKATSALDGAGESLVAYFTPNMYDLTFKQNPSQNDRDRLPGEIHAYFDIGSLSPLVDTEQIPEDWLLEFRVFYLESFNERTNIFRFVPARNVNGTVQVRSGL